MAVSIVNGYVCFSSCDVAAAKQGKDPNAPPGALPGSHDKKINALSHQPAVILDGALKDLADGGPTGDPGPADTTQLPSLNIIV